MCPSLINLKIVIVVLLLSKRNRPYDFCYWFFLNSSMLFYSSYTAAIAYDYLLSPTPIQLSSINYPTLSLSLRLSLSVLIRWRSDITSSLSASRRFRILWAVTLHLDPWATLDLKASRRSSAISSWAWTQQEERTRSNVWTFLYLL